jgi:hypothetical protein
MSIATPTATQLPLFSFAQNVDLAATSISLPITPETVEQSTRTFIAKVHDSQRKYTSLIGIANCRKSLRKHAKRVSLELRCSTVGKKTKKARVLGLQVCKSKTCVSCLSVFMIKTEFQLFMTMEKHILAGGEILFVTFTATSTSCFTPSHYSQEIEFKKSASYQDFLKSSTGTGSQDAIAKRLFDEWLIANPRPNSWEDWGLAKSMVAQREVMRNVLGSNRGWTKDRKEFGIEGWFWIHEIRVQLKDKQIIDPVTGDVTTVPDWKRPKSNPHIHAALFVGRTNKYQKRELKKRLTKRWVEGMEKLEFKASTRQQEFEWFSASTPEAAFKVSGYLTKTAYNITSGPQALKIADDGSKSYNYTQALCDAGGLAVDVSGKRLPPNPDAINYIRNFEGHMKGRHLTSWSQDIRKTYGTLDAERDAQLEKAISEKVQHLLDISPNAWSTFRNSGEAHIQLLNEVEHAADPQMAAVIFLEDWGMVEGTDFFIPEIAPAADSYVLTVAQEALYGSVELPY